MTCPLWSLPETQGRLEQLLHERPEFSGFEQQKLHDSEKRSGDDGKHDEEELEFLHAPSMSRRIENPYPQLPHLLNLPQKAFNGLNRTHFLLLDPGLNFFAFRPPALPNFKTG